jgi:DNA (cytosine-5)-methyltransferase 1
MSLNYPAGGVMNETSPVYLIKKARDIYSQSELASILKVSERTIRRWEVNETEPPAYLTHAIRQMILPLPFNDNKSSDFKFIDLFAGIGGIRIGFEELGGHCIFTSEWNEFSKKTYLANFSSTPSHVFAGDITRIDESDIPDHDVLLAGFPCQPFSIAGVSKKNSLGKPHGFECTTQGTLFFDVARILAKKRPAAFLLENVKNLVSHDNGNTFKIIYETLKNELGYDVHYKVIDARYFVPQHRERIIIVGFREKTGFSWNELSIPESSPLLGKILHPEDGSEKPEEPYTVGSSATVNPKYVLSAHLWQYLQDYAEKHRAAGNGFGFGLVDSSSTARTLSARYYKDGSEILVSRGKRKRPRRLTPRECARLMGYPDTFKIPVSDTQAYRQFGNSVVVPVIREVARIVVPHVKSILNKNDSGFSNLKSAVP